MGAPKFAILRTQKLKHLASVNRSLKHSFREQDTPNADRSREHENTHFGAQSAGEAQAAIKAKLPEKRRKDAVLAIEYLITASPEAMHDKTREQQDAYFADSMEWLKERHGAENVVYAGIHRDETTPHLYAYVVPLDKDTGRLNAKKWLGGSKALTQMQTDFANRVGAEHGLERGIERSKAKHTTIKEHYAAINKGIASGVTISPETIEPKVLKKGIFTKEVESPGQVAERLTKAVKDAYQPMAANAAVSSQERRRSKELQKTLLAQQKRLQAAQEPFKGLSREQFKSLVVGAVKMRQENEAARAAKIERQKEQRRQRRERGGGGLSR